jgi:hypothetical protein
MAVHPPSRQHNEYILMKVLSIPSSGACGQVVAYETRFGSIRRQRIVPKNTRSPAREHMRGAFGSFARAWGRRLTQAQRDLWNVAGPKVMSAPRLAQSGPLSGQQHFEGINCARACIGLPPLWVPPQPVVLGLNPVGRLIILNGANGVRLLLEVNGPVLEDIMVFGQAPCSAGRSKRRNVAYLCLLRAAEGGLSDITEEYVGRYGEPRAGEKVFIVTRQQKDGWERFDQETSEIVPAAPTEQQASVEPTLTLSVHMHKGSTRGAQGGSRLSVPKSQGSKKGEEEGGKGAKPGLGGGGGAGGGPDAPG